MRYQHHPRLRCITEEQESLLSDAIKNGRLPSTTHFVDRCRGDRTDPPPPFLNMVPEDARVNEEDVRHCEILRDMMSKMFSYERDVVQRHSAMKWSKIKKGAWFIKKGAEARSLVPGLLFKELGRQVVMQTAPNKDLGGPYELLELPIGTMIFNGVGDFSDDIISVDPFAWVGNSPIATLYAKRFNGGVMAYRLTRAVRLFALNESNTRRLYESAVRAGILHDRDEENSRVMRAFELKFGAGIDIVEQTRRVFGITDPNTNSRTHSEDTMDDLDTRAMLWPAQRPHFEINRTSEIQRFTYNSPPLRQRLFGFYQNDRVVAFFFWKLRRDLGVDGWFSPETTSPFHCSLSEELLFFDDAYKAPYADTDGVAPARTGRRTNHAFRSTGSDATITTTRAKKKARFPYEVFPAHPMHWRHWFSLLPLPRPPAPRFHMSEVFQNWNRDFVFTRHVLRNEESEASRKWWSRNGGKRPRGSGIAFLTFNVGQFNSLHAGFPVEMAVSFMCDILFPAAKVDVIALQCVPEAFTKEIVRVSSTTYPSAKWVKNFTTSQTSTSHHLLCLSRISDTRFKELNRQSSIGLGVCNSLEMFIPETGETPPMHIIATNINEELPYFTSAKLCNLLSNRDIARVHHVNVRDRRSHFLRIFDSFSNTPRSTQVLMGCLGVLDLAEKTLLKEQGFDVDDSGKILGDVVENYDATTAGGSTQDYILFRNCVPILASGEVIPYMHSSHNPVRRYMRFDREGEPFRFSSTSSSRAADKTGSIKK